MLSLSVLKHDLKIIQLRQFKTMQDNFNQRIKTMFVYVIQFRQKNANDPLPLKEEICYMIIFTLSESDANNLTLSTKTSSFVSMWEMMLFYEVAFSCSPRNAFFVG